MPSFLEKKEDSPGEPQPRVHMVPCRDNEYIAWQIVLLNHGDGLTDFTPTGPNPWVTTDVDLFRLEGAFGDQPVLHQVAEWYLVRT